MMAHMCNLSHLNPEGRGSQVQGQRGLHSKTLSHTHTHTEQKQKPKKTLNTDLLYDPAILLLPTCLRKRIENKDSDTCLMPVM